ncbi:hypothetical protein GCM10027578_21490 [Spirosoma luteolum]
MIISLLVTLCALASPTPLPPPGATWAVVVGIADYRYLTDQTGDLRLADRDAHQMAGFLQTSAGGRVPTSHIRLLTNRQATEATIRQALASFRQAGPADRVLFYFSGHGLPDRLVPADARAGGAGGGLTYAVLKQAFRASRAGVKLCIVDACLAGGLSQPLAPGAARSRSGFPAAGGGPVALLLATRPSQGALENRRIGGGLFTQVLLEGLCGRADADHNRVVTIRELHRYVSPRVRTLSNGRQAPLFYGRFSDNLALAYL